MNSYGLLQMTYEKRKAFCALSVIFFCLVKQISKIAMATENNFLTF